MEYKILHTIVLVFGIIITLSAIEILKKEKYKVLSKFQKITAWLAALVFYCGILYLIGLALIWIWS